MTGQQNVSTSPPMTQRYSSQATQATSHRSSPNSNPPGTSPQGDNSQSSGSQGYSMLSERELEIVELVAVGLTNEKIADQLEISKRTVDNHISNILNKTSTHNRVELVRWALQWGKVCLDQINCCVLPQPQGGNPALQDAALPSESP